MATWTKRQKAERYLNAAVVKADKGDIEGSEKFFDKALALENEAVVEESTSMAA